MPQTEEVLKGQVTQIRYRSQDGGDFAIAYLEDGTAIKGPIAAIRLYAPYELFGRWEEHKQYGKQFKVRTYRMTYPTDLVGIGAYLRNNIKWIGPTTATAMLQKYGDQTLNILRDEPERVASEISGISLGRAITVSAEMKANKKVENLLVELENIFSGTMVNRGVVDEVRKIWKEAAPDRIRKNPYSLIGIFRGVGFLTADSVAKKLGIANDDLFRVKAGVVYTMQQLTMRGHVCYPRMVLITEGARLLKVKGGTVEAALKVLALPEEVEEGDPQPPRVVLESGFYYLPSVYEDEHYIANKIKELLEYPFDPVRPYFAGLAPDQKDAVIAVAAGSGVFILTGAPGTGKTYAAKRILDSFTGKRVLQVAPTGKAAKRLQEQTGQEAMTIHRALEPLPQAGAFIFGRDEQNPLDADIVVCDESSMLDNWLTARLLHAMRPSARLILIGDVHQLPSVGAGNILKDMIAAGVPSIELETIKRQDAGLIIRNCHRVKNGMDIETPVDPDLDFMFIPREGEDAIQKTIITLLQKLPTSKQIDKLDDIQVIVPRRAKVALSCASLNPILQKVLVGDPGEGNKFQEGDKVIQTVNEYVKGLVNGDIGKVKEIIGKDMWVKFDNPVREVQLDVKSNGLELAYAITCHKFQGSECQVIIAPIHTSGGALVCQRNWLYTAISRAQKLCILVGDRVEINKIIKRKSQQVRYTRLAARLKNEQEKPAFNVGEMVMTDDDE